MKLDRMARHDPVNGVWCRVCAACFASRPGYIDHHGATRSLTAAFVKRREKAIDRVHLESNRLEKRLEKVNIGFLFITRVIDGYTIACTNSSCC